MSRTLFTRDVVLETRVSNFNSLSVSVLARNLESRSHLILEPRSRAVLDYVEVNQSSSHSVNGIMKQMVSVASQTVRSSGLGAGT